MKNVTLKIATFLLVVFFTNCAKDNTEPDPDPTVAVDPGVFNWQLSSGSNVKADSAFFYQQFTTIFAFKNGNSNSIEINLSSLSAGTYTFSSSSGNIFTYANGSSTFGAGTGTCNISSSVNNKLSGSFNVNFASTSLGSISGNFSNILRK